MTEEKAAEKPTPVFDTDRGERQEYLEAHEDADITLPVTRDGFQALMEVVCGGCALPVDDNARQVIAQHVHHIPNDYATTTISKLRVVLTKALANALTWGVDQEIKAKRLAEQKAARDAFIAEEKAKAERERQLGAANVEPQADPPVADGQSGPASFHPGRSRAKSL